MVHSYDHSKLETSSWCKKHDFGSSNLRNTKKYEDRTQSKMCLKKAITNSCRYSLLKKKFRLSEIFIPFRVPKISYFVLPKRTVPDSSKRGFQWRQNSIRRNPVGNPGSQILDRRNSAGSRVPEPKTCPQSFSPTLLFGHFFFESGMKHLSPPLFLLRADPQAAVP